LDNTRAAPTHDLKQTGQLSFTDENKFTNNITSADEKMALTLALLVEV
jgi:hypothetical protein